MTADGTSTYTGRVGEVLAFLARLDDASIHHRLTVVRPEALMVEVAVPGERWEIEFTADGEVEVEVFAGNGEIRDRSALEDLLDRFGD